MAEAVWAEVSGERLVAVYRLAGDEGRARALAEAITIEQTVEFPRAYLPPGNLASDVVGRVEDLTPEGDGSAAWRAAISFAVENTGMELPQLLNVIWGNVSLIPGVRLEAVSLPQSLLARFPGPRFGRDGLRARLGVQGRALVATALKPMGLAPGALAAEAAAFTRGGVDLVKDDHGLSDQPFAPWRERVARVIDAVREANAQTGGHTLYLPNVSGPADVVAERAREAKRLGCGGLLVSPGLVGFDAMRALSQDDSLDLPIMAHPAFLGSMVTSGEGGIAHEVLFGTLMRLAGADAVIFPNYGGRFAFSPDECRRIMRGTGYAMGACRPAFPVPGGGMTLERVPEMLATYGEDVVLLIGGALFATGDPEGESRRFAAWVQEAAQPGGGAP